ncbi:putative ATP-dependent DNA helicase [Paenibacillus sp. TCA20]|uniref:ATP-dependent helicase n=1 Tax=Paenibacillus sp. TCA20 TaxID=1499968 RepID=UPI0004D9BFB4|nr:UvrD-helicase domain-containing protein [Paenibacillus sp. TCA20]GAK41939.1 putative ATP-dependent DNA helicase [Paenibacillus sp. TCA20]
MATEERVINNVISMDKVKELLDELNPEQRMAAEAIYGPVLVLAGAGSGKTKTLTNRIANILAHGEKASSIFVATFTNKAAKEMKERIAKAVGEEAVRDLWMGTFHSLCVRILRKHGHLLGYESNFTIMDTGDSLDLIKRIYKKLNVDENTKPGLALHYIDQAKNNLFTPEYCLHEQAESANDQMCALVYQDFQLLAKEMNAMDFGDLIMNVVKLLEEFPDACNYWQNRFKFVLSDEYQDANHAQYHLLRLLAFPHNNLFVVGDPQQSIYKFRGAAVNLILSFESQYFPCTTVRLSTNYRSNHVIVRAGNELMKQNSHMRLELVAKQSGTQCTSYPYYENTE